MTVTIQNGWWHVDGRPVMRDCEPAKRVDRATALEEKLRERTLDAQAVIRHVSLICDPIVEATAKELRRMYFGGNCEDWEFLSSDARLEYIEKAKRIVIAQNVAAK